MCVYVKWKARNNVYGYLYPNRGKTETSTAQKMFSIKDFLSKCDQIRSFVRIWSHLLRKSLMDIFIFRKVSRISVHFALTCWPKQFWQTFENNLYLDRSDSMHYLIKIKSGFHSKRHLKYLSIPSKKHLIIFFNLQNSLTVLHRDYSFETIGNSSLMADKKQFSREIFVAFHSF